MRAKAQIARGCSVGLYVAGVAALGAGLLTAGLVAAATVTAAGFGVAACLAAAGVAIGGLAIWESRRFAQRAKRLQRTISQRTVLDVSGGAASETATPESETRLIR